MPRIVYGASVDEGKAKFDAHQFEEAYEILKPYADQGDLEALKFIGLMYWNGQGVEINYIKGCDYFQKASLENDPEAISFLGLCYIDVRGREKNIEEAYLLLKKGYEGGYREYGKVLGALSFFLNRYEKTLERLLPYALNGDVDAMVWVGVLFRDGKGIEQNHKTACEWFEKALPSKNVQALHNFGDCSYFGLDRLVDKEGAYRYFKEAADLGSEKSKSAAEAIFEELYGQASQ